MSSSRHPFKKYLSSILTGAVVVLVLAGLSAWLWSGGNKSEDLASLDVTASPERKPARFEDELFTTAKGGDSRAMTFEATQKTGVRGLRARKVKFNSEPLRVANRFGDRPNDRLVRFQLFSDTVFMVRFMEPSPQLNRRAQFVGQVEGDPDSRVQIWATKTAITGELVTAGRTFRFVPTTGGFHYIIEVEPSR